MDYLFAVWILTKRRSRMLSWGYQRINDASVWLPEVPSWNRSLRAVTCDACTYRCNWGWQGVSPWSHLQIDRRFNTTPCWTLIYNLMRSSKPRIIFRNSKDVPLLQKCMYWKIWRNPNTNGPAQERQRKWEGKVFTPNVKGHKKCISQVL